MYQRRSFRAPAWGLTNDLLYESKDSRDIGNGSMSDSLFPVLIEVPEGWDRFGQKPFFSGGEG